MPTTLKATMSSEAGPSALNPHTERRRKRRQELSEGQEEIEKAVNADRAYRNYHARVLKQSAEWRATAPEEQPALLQRQEANMWQARRVNSLISRLIARRLVDN